MVLAWLAASIAAGPMLIPWPWTVLQTLALLVPSQEFWSNAAVTLVRTGCGLSLALLLAFAVGVPAGRSSRVMQVAGPIVAALQSCPPIVWITLLLVWLGSGSATPVTVVTATVFPPLFANIAQGCMSLDQRMFAMAKFYGAPWRSVLLRLLVPGLAPYVLAGLSYALATSWKVATVAEFLASGDGVGARIYWSYHMLEMESLLAWTVVVVGVGVALEACLVSPLRSLAARTSISVKCMGDVDKS